jgi:hypothetical protein
MPLKFFASSREEIHGLPYLRYRNTPSSKGIVFAGRRNVPLAFPCDMSLLTQFVEGMSHASPSYAIMKITE